VADAITAARRGFDFVVVDMHPSLGPELPIFDRRQDPGPSDPRRPPCGAVQLRDVATTSASATAS
jgi:hypothetical protein